MSELKDLDRERGFIKEGVRYEKRVKWGFPRVELDFRKI